MNVEHGSEVHLPAPQPYTTKVKMSFNVTWYVKQIFLNKQFQHYLYTVSSLSTAFHPWSDGHQARSLPLLLSSTVKWVGTEIIQACSEPLIPLYSTYHISLCYFGSYKGKNPLFQLFPAAVPPNIVLPVGDDSNNNGE